MGLVGGRVQMEDLSSHGDNHPHRDSSLMTTGCSDDRVLMATTGPGPPPATPLGRGRAGAATLAPCGPPPRRNRPSGPRRRSPTGSRRSARSGPGAGLTEEMAVGDCVDVMGVTNSSLSASSALVGGHHLAHSSEERVVGHHHLDVETEALEHVRAPLHPHVAGGRRLPRDRPRRRTRASGTPSSGPGPARLVPEAPSLHLEAPPVGRQGPSVHSGYTGWQAAGRNTTSAGSRTSTQSRPPPPGVRNRACSLSSPLKVWTDPVRSGNDFR